MHGDSPAADTCILILVRHGATQNNLCVPPRLQGCRSDMELSAEGLAQAEQTARFLASHAIAAVYSSPLKRALQTAAAIAQPHRLAVQTVDALIECDVGDWEGRAWPDIEREEPDAYRRFVSDPYQHPYRGGEDLSQVHARVVPVFHDLAQRHLGTQIVVVAHNVINRVFLGALLDVLPAKRRGVPQENCGLNLVEYRNGEAKVLTLNSAFHLDSPPA
jgi:broad specificity phosphatase PhoE